MIDVCSCRPRLHKLACEAMGKDIKVELAISARPKHARDTLSGLEARAIVRHKFYKGFWKYIPGGLPVMSIVTHP